VSELKEVSCKFAMLRVPDNVKVPLTVKLFVTVPVKVAVLPLNDVAVTDVAPIFRNEISLTVKLDVLNPRIFLLIYILFRHIFFSQN